MLSLDFICQHPDIVREGLRKRRLSINLDEILRLAEQRRALITRCDGLHATIKSQREQIKTLPVGKRAVLNAQTKLLSEELQQLELQGSDLKTRLNLQLLSLPNLPQASVKENSEQEGDNELRRWGHQSAFQFKPLPHWEVGARLGLIDSEGGVRIAGSRFVALRGAGAKLERALISFMLDTHTTLHGYTEILPPQLVKRSVMVGSGQLPKFEEQAYVCEEDELYLNPTAEVPLIGLHSHTTFSFDELPLRYVAWTTAFRREAGASSRQNRGLLRLHQFNKVELFQYVFPTESANALRQMVEHAERILQLLELPYRVVALDAAQLPFSAARAFDIEVWMPGMDEYIEISSISNCEAFQTRRAEIKYRPQQGAAMYPHTLNASGLAVGRTMAAILETYQQADGSVIIPKVLRPYMGVSELAAPVE
ncbi:serine--tRNA ligase [Tengunoibacter tsumagoiensis]|uniref:Serine--tRNA ligase n=1 Tax=Tengunoibacter tsumagoiensis TaxID=2014871 RepID=A0A401ZXT9_9CHLR|nr:serine--tRNA ligase [Tengunoibacter tsumagoiensis]GCE11652.1 serine--tRNA ligase [Tengunoibacter tsumagoiensis]